METTVTCLAGGSGRAEIERRDQMLSQQNEHRPTASPDEQQAAPIYTHNIREILYCIR